MQRTNTTILFPEAGKRIEKFVNLKMSFLPFFRHICFGITIHYNISGDTNIPSIRKGSVTITGSIHNIYFARQQLLVRWEYLQSFLY